MTERASPTGDYEGIVILGSPRSGTTLLRRILNAHPSLCCPPETHVLNACGRFLREEPFAEGLTMGVVPGLAYSGIGEEQVLERLRELAFSLFRDICRSAGKQRWVEKSPYDIFHIDQIERLCGDRCRYICLFRHPLDVAISTRDLCQQMQMYASDLHDYVRRYPAPLEAFAHAWVDCNRRLLRFRADHPQLAVSLRYEDLIAEPEAELSRVLDFLGEPADVSALVGQALEKADSVGLEDWKTYETRQMSNRSIGRWLELDDDTVFRLAGIVAPLLSELGYDEIPIKPAASAEEARRQHQIRLMAAMMTSGESAPPDDPTSGQG